MICYYYIKILIRSFFITAIILTQASSMDLAEKITEVEKTTLINSAVPFNEFSSPIKPVLRDSANPPLTIDSSKLLGKYIPQDGVNLNEDIPGCTDNYFRCCIAYWRISKGWHSIGS